jgi:NAD(P)H-hydrate epimerase
VPEATQLLLAEPGAAAAAEEASASLAARWGDFDALGIGPGLGTAESARRLVADALERFAGPAVFDADALNLIAAEPALVRAKSPERVWTPHPGELERLTGERPKGDDARLEAARRAGERLGGVVVLKGHRTVVAGEDRYYVNDTGNPGMATGGAGDVLTGVIASLLGQGFKPFEAAALGVRLHGAAGDLAAAALGEASLIAGDLIDHLPAAIRAHGGRKP